MIGGDPVPSFTTEPSQQSQGEMFTSVRQLLKRYTTMNQEFNTTPPVGQPRFYWPWHGSVYSATGAGSGYAGSWALNGDAYSIISPLYAFYRGGINVRTTGAAGANPFSIDSNFGTTAIYTSLANHSITRAERAIGGSIVGRKVPFIGVSDYNSNTTGFAFTVPYASRTHCSLNCQPTSAAGISTSGAVMSPIPQYTSTGAPGPVDFSQPSTVLVIPGSNSGSQTAFSRSIGEDFQFSYFIGCVPRLTNIGLVP